jgi:hypothetical protein
MTFGRRLAEVKYHEENRGTILRNISFAGIAASWALREELNKLNAPLVWAIIFFGLYLMVDVYYAHYAAVTEREELWEQEDEFKKNNGRVPNENDPAPYSLRKVSCSACFSKYKPLIVAAGYVSLVLGAKEILAKIN